MSRLPPLRGHSTDGTGEVHEIRYWKRGRQSLWHAEELAPCGEAGKLTSYSGWPGVDHDVRDCLVSRPKPFRLVIWEPLRTKAPGPNLTAPLCCYIRTVIFYCAPYRKALHIGSWRGRDGVFRIERTRGFEEWGRCETRLGWDDRVAFDGDLFEVGAGHVTWAQRRWWMLHSARRIEAAPNPSPISRKAPEAA